MSGIKLEYNKESIIIERKNNLYQINCIKQWIFLTKFKKAYLLIQHPNGCIETIVDRKFIYNQDYELICDLDFNYRFIYPLGNFTENINFYLIDIVPFTGTFNGNNYKIKNINIINCNYNGLFGITKMGMISNLIIENITIGDGIYNGALVSKAYSTDISNIKIIGNILMKGKYCSCFIGLVEGNCKNIDIIVDGEIEADKKSLVSNYYYGNIENVSVISKIQNSINCFDIINGRIKNISFISWITVPNVFYNQTKYHQISNCYYFQLNNDKLPEPQIIYNYYFRNLNEVNYDNIKNSSQWVKIGYNYYLNNVINYTNDDINSNLIDNIKFYDIKSDVSNIEGAYIDINGLFKGVDYLESFNKNNIIIKCKKMENIYIRETNCSKELDILNNKNLIIRLNSIKSHMDNNEQLNYKDKLILENNSHRYEDYESDSQCVTSEEDIHKLDELNNIDKLGNINKLNNIDKLGNINKLDNTNSQDDANSQDDTNDTIDNKIFEYFDYPLNKVNELDNLLHDDSLDTLDIFIINKKLESDEKMKTDAINNIQEELELIEQEMKLLFEL